MDEALFPLGRLLITPGALLALLEAETPPITLLSRHVQGDWGEMDELDQAANRTSIKEGLRILSAFHIDDVKFYVITEADRSATTILLADEY